MTYLRRIAQLVSDLRELDVIKEEDKIEYDCIDVHQITISTRIPDDKKKLSIIIRYTMIYNAFLEEFSQEEIVYQEYDCNMVNFVFHRKS